MAVISIVDDDPSVRRALLRLLRAAGYSAEAFASGEEYLHSAAAARTACLVLDVRLGSTTGFDLQASLAAGPDAPPIIFITAHDDSLTRERVWGSGAVAYLPKPFEADVLLDVVRRIVGPR